MQQLGDGVVQALGKFCVRFVRLLLHWLSDAHFKSWRAQTREAFSLRSCPQSDECNGNYLSVGFLRK